MTVTVKNKADLVVPASLQRRAGIGAGDRVEFKVSARTITITAVPQKTYKATKAELVAIRKGEAQLARGQSIRLTCILHELGGSRRKGGAKQLAAFRAKDQGEALPPCSKWPLILLPATSSSWKGKITVGAGAWAVNASFRLSRVLLVVFAVPFAVSAQSRTALKPRIDAVIANSPARDTCLHRLRIRTGFFCKIGWAASFSAGTL